MAPSGGARPSLIVDWAVGARPCDGETRSGDHHVVAPFAGGVLLAAIDGLGHGPEAAASAHQAAELLAAHASPLLEALVRLCHHAMRHGRGAAMSLAAFDAGSETMSWLGIGNVDGVLFRADAAAERPREHLLQRGGVVGDRLPPLRIQALAIVPGDVVVLATDGIGSKFAELSPVGRDPQPVADEILARYGKTNDDALVLVARYGGLAR